MNWLLKLDNTWESRGNATGMYTIQRRLATRFYKSTLGKQHKFLRDEWALFNKRGKLLFSDPDIAKVKSIAEKHWSMPSASARMMEQLGG